jgi:hypothetical protein
VRTASLQRHKTGTAKASRADTARVARDEASVGNALSDLTRSAGGSLSAQHPLFADYASVMPQDMTSDPYFPSSTHDCAMDPQQQMLLYYNSSSSRYFMRTLLPRHDD